MIAPRSLVFVAVLALLTTLANSGRSPVIAEPSASVAHGRYLVIEAVHCVGCHGARLEGATLSFFKPGLPFAYHAPRIAGLPGLTADQATRFFETGVLPGGMRARPPMPPFRFNHGDAVAIVAYLRSLH